MVPLSLFATARRHLTWLRSVREHMACSLGRPVCTGLKKKKGLASRKNKKKHP